MYTWGFGRSRSSFFAFNSARSAAYFSTVFCLRLLRSSHAVFAIGRCENTRNVGTSKSFADLIIEGIFLVGSGKEIQKSFAGIRETWPPLGSTDNPARGMIVSERGFPNPCDLWGGSGLG